MAKRKSSSINEKFYQDQWEKDQVYAYQEDSHRKRFVIDTPPPTVSGTLHIGHLFSYTQADILARFQRMNGQNVFYPMGWDNNGLPTEKRVQKLHHIICDPSLRGYSNISNQQKISRPRAVSREQFIAICRQQTQEDQKQYEALWRRLALSVDWNQTYETISDFSRSIAQRSFLDLYRKSAVENRFSPVFWDTQFKTAVAQADIEDRKINGAYYNIQFQIQGSMDKFTIATTRPELLPACVAVVAHPEDSRYRHLFGQRAITALFSCSVPILPSLHADPEKGTGILMICTFGDKEDWEFWHKHNDSVETVNDQLNRLPLKQVIGSNGHMMPIVFVSDTTKLASNEFSFVSLNSKRASEFYSKLQGLHVQKARKQIVQLLQEEGSLKETHQCLHSVKYYEKGDLPLELILTRQWYIKILEHKESFLQRGKQVQWHPLSMRKRYEQWVEGLNQDWCISRQRFFGVPFPVWYPLDSDKKPNYSQPIFSPEGECVDPITQAPADVYRSLKNSSISEMSIHSHSMEFLKHCTEEKRDKAGGFIADQNVMDTWAVSSLTPQINSHWEKHTQRHQDLFPADLRSQAHEIIRTWAFYTIVKSHFHAQTIPWRHIAVSGWVMHPDRLKLSKSKDRSVSAPHQLMDQYGVDAIRYWAGKSRLGQDTVYDENVVKNGQRLVVKLLNAFRFMLIQVSDSKWSGVPYKKLNTLVDQAWILYLHHTHKKAGEFLQNFEYAPALEEIEKTFWLFCDHYLELVKARAYRLKDQLEGQSAIHALDLSLYFFIKMLAPFLPYITEHLWSQRYQTESSSVHQSHWSFVDAQEMTRLWPEKNSYDFNKLCNFIFNLLEQIRAKKSEQHRSVSAAIQRLSIEILSAELPLWKAGAEDIARAVNVDLKNVKLQTLDEVKEKTQTGSKITIQKFSAKVLEIQFSDL